MPRTTNAPPPFLMTGVHERILKDALYPYHLLTARQITRLLYPTEKQGMFTTIKSRLKALTDAKYLTNAHLPTAENVRPFVYCLGLHGKKTLTQEGYDIATYFEKVDLEQRSPGWYYHLLELNDFFITAVTLQARVAPLHLFEWMHDYTIAQHPPQAIKKDGKVAQVNPDGFLHFVHTLQVDGAEKQRHYRFLVELDRGTESDDKFRKKIRDYLTCYEQEALQTHFSGKLLVFLFPTTAGERRVEKMRHLARIELKAADKTISETSFRNKLFQFASVSPLMQPPLDPKTIFTTPFWTLPYGEPTDKKTLIELSQ